ncbi:hypothetical protein TNCV_3751771 [Trichonephila clavipes]|nr:hypothetical protein TNCV_3751771 [Trichonephila clavipes]
MLVGLLSRWCFLIGGHGRRQWAERTGDFGGLRKNQVQIRASRREARLLLVVRSRLIMANLSDQPFPPTNLGHVDEEMVPPGRGVSQAMITAEVCYKCITNSFLIDKCEITEINYIANLEKQA